MGFFGKMFEKKVCDICGGEIGLLGNRKLEDGNLCKACAAKLSPWFSERKTSTVEEIRAQLAYREENQAAVEQFHTTRSIGRNMRVCLDEDAGKFLVTGARNLSEANPDVLDYVQVTGCELDIQERREELKREGKDGTKVSYNPPRYTFDYDFYMLIRVNHPYFDQMRFRLNPSSVEITPPPGTRTFNPRTNRDYQEFEQMGGEIKTALMQARRQVRAQAAAAAAPKKAVTCPCCGATTTPDTSGCCEYCGGSVNG